MKQKCIRKFVEKLTFKYYKYLIDNSYICENTINLRLVSFLTAFEYLGFIEEAEICEIVDNVINSF